MLPALTACTDTTACTTACTDTTACCQPDPAPDTAPEVEPDPAASLAGESAEGGEDLDNGHFRWTAPAAKEAEEPPAAALDR